MDRESSPYSRIRELTAADSCVVLDGAIGTELIEVGGGRPELEEHVWGVSEMLDAPERVEQVHRRYAEAGADVLTTNTWGLPTALRDGRLRDHEGSAPVHWMDLARDAVAVARSAAATGEGERAVAFSLNGDVEGADGAEAISLLTRAFADEPPDIILLETLSLVRESTYATVEALMQTGVPVWLSFRRCRQGVCGVYGEHWGGPEGDTFGRAARRFEQMGVDALLINCIPPDHVTGMLSWLRDFTDLPLGVYPNLGYLSATGWRHAYDVDPARYADMALGWREEGAQIIGGCCGVGPAHIAAARTSLEGTRRGHRRPSPATHENGSRGAARRVSPWQDARGRRAFPLPFPDIVVDRDVAGPTQGSFLLWKHLSGDSIGAHQRCLDVGAGAGLLTVQLARNGANHVHAIDVDPAATSNTMTNAFRNDVADRISAATVDLFPWVPEERYDVIVASLDQDPVDPFEQPTSHHPVDYWGRNLFDHLVGLLPEALADDGVAYLVQLSIIGQQRTLEQVEALGCTSRVVDYAFVENVRGSEQLARVEARSDAYHLTFGANEVLVAYLIEVTRDRTADKLG